jgi:oxygen-independent coproporphyrinogen-3 oxidase
MPETLPPIALYLHWPFCISKCPYCDFNSHVTDYIDEKRWEINFDKVISNYKELLEQRQISSIYFGGGTPSLMSPELVEQILGKLDSLSGIKPNTEITLEANPTSSEAKKFEAFRKTGINRLSIGIQSLKDEGLQFLGRGHSASEATRVVEMAKNIFPRYSFDLIYARQNQKLDTWSEELSEALEMEMNHISLYQLMIEKGTQFYKDHKAGKITTPEEESKAEMYDYTNRYLTDKGLARYEISNYAVPGEESRHNLSYWRYQEYLGIGPGAHSRLLDGAGNNLAAKGEAYNSRMRAKVMHHDPEKWLQAAEEGEELQQNYKLTTEQLVEEMLIMNLRIPEGLDKDYFYKLTGKEFDSLFPSKLIHALEENNFARNTKQRFYLTDAGMNLHQQVIQKLYSMLDLS